MNLWVFLMVVVFMANGTTTEERSNSNGLTASSTPRDLDIKLRKALLKALNELENEESENQSDKLVERAPASSFTIYDNSKPDVYIAPKQSDTSTIIYPTEIMNSPVKNNQSKIDMPLVILQKSEGVQQKTITTFEEGNSELDSNDVEQIISSASSSLTSNDSQLDKSYIATDPIETINKMKANTTIAPSENGQSTSTEENELRVENVQFFSAPLVAAFTVHQDELGLPKKVESIFKQEFPSKLDTYFTQKQILQETQKLNALRQEEIFRQQNKKLVNQPQLKLEEVKQGEILRKQNTQQEQTHKSREEEMLKSNFNFKQKHGEFSMHQEQPRLQNNALPFLSIPNTGFNGLIGNNLQSQQLPTRLSLPVIERLPITEPIPTIQQLPVKPAGDFDRNVVFLKNSVSVLPSITFDPLIEAGKLPLNAQILPIKPPINFNSPILQTPQFQQFHSVSPFNINVNQLPSLPSLVQPQSNRLFRQESDVGNFPNNKNTDTVFIQQSIQPPPIPEYFLEGDIFLRSNTDTNRQQAFLQQYPQQSNRVFRSNPESTFTSPNNFYRHQQHHYQPNNLLFKPSALRQRSPEDFNIITNILELNHSGSQRYANFVRQNQRIPNYQKL